MNTKPFLKVPHLHVFLAPPEVVTLPLPGQLAPMPDHVWYQISWKTSLLHHGHCCLYLIKSLFGFNSCLLLDSTLCVCDLGTYHSFLFRVWGPGHVISLAATSRKYSVSLWLIKSLCHTVLCSARLNSSCACIQSAWKRLLASASSWLFWMQVSFPLQPVGLWGIDVV